jgi:hypothetical protein
MWKGLNDKGVGAVHELNVVEECHEVEQETGWCSSSSAVILERVGRGRQPMGLHVSMGA